MSANAMDQAGYPGASLEQKWRGEWETFGGFVKGRERVFWVCVVHAGADVRVDGVGGCAACWKGAGTERVGGLGWFYGGVTGGRVLLLRIYLLTE